MATGGKPFVFKGGGLDKDRRNLKGYWKDYPPSPWPSGARLAVSLVVNIEEGAERSIGDGDICNEGIHEAAEEVIGNVDPCMESHFAYGPRIGYERIISLLEQHNIPATFSTCGRAAQRTPWLIRDIVDRDHEVACHGWVWQTHAGLSRAEVKTNIYKTYDVLKSIAGTAPVGWHTRSASSIHTRELLLEHGGFLYDSDAYDDDVPRIEEYGDQHHVILPYAFDTNDMRFRPGGSFVFADDFTRYCAAAFDQLWLEGLHSARMLSIGLHVRTIGRPARINGLANLLDYMVKKGNVWFATRKQIAQCWRQAIGLPDFEPHNAPSTESTSIS